MPSWNEVEAEAPELASLARSFLDAHVHKTIATLRRDGSPRISGTEVIFAEGELWLGEHVAGAVKALDLRRDPRFALHSGSADPRDGWAMRSWPGAWRRSRTRTGSRRSSAIRGERVPCTCSARM